MKYLFHLLLPLLATFSLSAQSLFSGGTGTESDPYRISTEQDLRELARQVNEDHNTFFGQYLLQTADITFSTDTPVEPIGGPVMDDSFYRDDSECFRGTYDGGMHKIYNLNLYDAKQLNGKQGAFIKIGLFGSLGTDGTVKNVVIASGHIYGYSHVGAIAGTIHARSTVSHCKVGPDVRVYAYSTAAGVVGTSIDNNNNILQCANYANVIVYGTGLHKSAGGIVSSSGYARIEGCANFGDIWGPGGFVGGIIGYFPRATPEFQFAYNELKSCMNAGDITSIDPVAGGLIGAVGYNYTMPDGSPRPHQQISNSYSYGQTWTAFSSSYGPVVGLFFKQIPVTVSKTYYNVDRFYFKPDGSADSEIAYALGEAKQHEEMTSAAFLTTLNEGAPYPFEEDIHHINANMPVLKWINDSYDPEIDKPNQYRKDLKPSLFKRPAGSFFPPNRGGDFLIYNVDMLQPSIQSKSFGCSTDRGWVERVLPAAQGKSYTYFLSSSAFRNQVGEDGKYAKPRPQQTADHWLITPEFTVNADAAWFHWVAASEDASVSCGYELYVADENATTPEAFATLEPIFKTESEEPVKQLMEMDGEQQRFYYELNDRKVDLSKYAGKRIRLAFRDNSTDKFFLMVGKMKMARENSINTPETTSPAQIAVDRGTITVQANMNQHIELFDAQGMLINKASYHLQSQVVPGIYLVRISDASGVVHTHKVVVP